MKHTITTSLAILAMVAMACDSQAFWGRGGSYGSYGGYGSAGSYGGYGSSGSYAASYGSSGSYGGSYGSSGSYSASYGSSGSFGGGLLSRIGSRIRAHHGSSGGYGSSGSYAVSYGSSGSYGASYGSSGSYGASYGSSGSYGGYSTPVYDDCGCDGGCDGGCAGGCDTCGGTVVDPHYASTSTGSGMLRVSVPADAKVYVNGKLTTSTGTDRQYVSHNLQSGRTYSYDVRVEYTSAGQPVTEQRQVSLTAGSDELLAFTAPAVATPVATTLKLNVPAEARVTLAGAATQQTGAHREFVTTKLAAGQMWNDYRVQVELAGQVEEKVISLKGGDVQSIDFEFTGLGTQVALRD